MHLDLRSWYSFHDGTCHPALLCRAAAELGHKAVGLCDVDGTYGLIDFHREALSCGLQPVLGLALTDPVALAQLGAKADPTQSAALVLAKNRSGYSQLCELAARRRLDEHFDLRSALHSGTSDCYVITERSDLIDFLAPRLGPRRLFVRLDPDYGEGYREKQRKQLRLAERAQLSTIACSDVRFASPKQQPVHHVLRAIGQNTSLPMARGVRPRRHYLCAPADLTGCYYDHQEALAAAWKVAEGCEVVFDGGWAFPRFEGTEDQSKRRLRELCLRGLAWRYGEGGYEEKHFARLDYELAVIEKLGYSSYFLFVYDIVRAAGRMRIPYVGRGSAANSIVSYLLGLTPVDPLMYNMYFERFLNPDRKSPPDIDIDFSSDRRDDILEYVYERWGRERVAMISTHVTYRARGAFREVAKVFGLSDSEIRLVSRYIPHISAPDLRGIQQRFPEMRGVDFSAEPFRYIIPLASRMGGCPRHLGIHCGGIVIAPDKLTDYTGLQRAAKGFVVTQYDMHSVEKAGLIKIDLLGNCGLQAFEGALKNLARRGIKTPVRDLAAAVSDPATVASIREGRTMGCFYIESPAMRSLLKRLGTSTFEDLTIASSVIRPGVAESGMMQEYIRRTHGLERKLPSHPLMERLLPETKGVMVFQEDVIRVAHEIAGLTPAEGDLLRRAMSGKLRSRERILEMKQRFVAGCISRGVGPEGAEELWRQTESFSGYSFCKAHSASFATLSFQVAWLKAHYPADFMAAVLSHHGGFYSNSAYLSECRRLGLKVFPPDVNHSEFDYVADWSRQDHSALPDAVRVGLSVIGNVRGDMLARIPEERQQHGRYASLNDFIRRARPQQAELSVLIQCGALDSLGLTRPELQWLADSEYAAALRGLTLPLDDSARLSEFRRSFGARLRDFDEATRLRMELTHFGMLISRHPLELVPALPGIVSAAELEQYSGRRVKMIGVCIAYKRVLLSARIKPEGLLALQSSMADAPTDKYRSDDDEELSTAEDIGLSHHGWAGMQASQQRLRDERPRLMMFMSMEDRSGTFEVTLFEKAYERYAQILREGAAIFIVTGKVEEQFGTASLNADTLEVWDENSDSAAALASRKAGEHPAGFSW